MSCSYLQAVDVCLLLHLFTGITENIPDPGGTETSLYYFVFPQQNGLTFMLSLIWPQGVSV